MSNLEILWDTYDFILNKIVSLEDEFSHLIDNAEVDSAKFKKLCTQLNNAYGKQLLTIRELKDFYKNNPKDITKERRVAVETFEELEEVTEELKQVIGENISDL